MNKTKFVCLVIALLCVIPCFSKELTYKGDWRKKHKSVDMDLPIVGFIEENTNTLVIYFRENLGIVYVSVFDVNQKIIYQESVLTTEISSLTITLDGLCDKGTLLVTDGINNVYSDLM